MIGRPRVGDACEVLEYPVFVDPKSGAMIWRHQHQHAAPAAAALRPRSTAICVLKWLQVTITGLRPAT